jgi:hypothetical protein
VPNKHKALSSNTSAAKKKYKWYKYWKYKKQRKMGQTKWEGEF